MFRDTRKEKLRNRVIFAALGVAVLTFGIWLNYQDGAGEDTARKTTQEAAVAEAVKKTEASGIDSASSEIVSDEDAEDTDADMERMDGAADGEEHMDGQKTQAGTDTGDIPEAYLIKEVDGVVKVFVCDEAGNQELYLITSIPFDLLSESDQQLFIDGVKLETEEDLGKFLENFDS